MYAQHAVIGVLSASHCMQLVPPRSPLFPPHLLSPPPSPLLLQAKHESTVELFKYVTAVTLRHGLDNPKTRARRSKERLQALLSFTVRLGTTAVVVAALTGVGLYVSDYRGSRAKTHDAVEVVVRRVKEVVLGAGASGSNGAGKAAQR